LDIYDADCKKKYIYKTKVQIEMQVSEVQPLAPTEVAPVQVAEQPQVLDGGGGKKKVRRSRKRTSRGRRSRSMRSKTRKMHGGEFGKDAYGFKDVGKNPSRKNFGITGLATNDFETFQMYENNPSFLNAEQNYEKLAKLHKQMMRSGLNSAEARVLIDNVLAYNATVENGEMPQWVKEYAAAVDEKLQQVKFALDSGDESLATSYEWQALVEEKRLAYMIMEALSGIAIGTGEGAREWRRTRAMGYEDPLPSNALFSAFSGPRSPRVMTNQTTPENVFGESVSTTSSALTKNAPATSVIPDLSNIFGSSSLGGGKKKCKSYQRRSRRTGHCVGQKKSVSRR
jgi:hypothetical protein